MEYYVVKGGSPLSGEVEIAGAKRGACDRGSCNHGR